MGWAVRFIVMPDVAALASTGTSTLRSWEAQAISERLSKMIKAVLPMYFIFDSIRSRSTHIPAVYSIFLVIVNLLNLPDFSFEPLGSLLVHLTRQQVALP